MTVTPQDLCFNRSRTYHSIKWKKIMKHLLGLALAAASFSAFSGNFTNPAVPTRIDLVQAGSAGFMLFGEFGNPSNCTVANQVFVEINHPQYSQIYSTALAALMAGKKIWVYAHACKPALWYTTDNITYNTMEQSGSLSVVN